MNRLLPVLSAAACLHAAAAADRPNILLILADDMGFSDIGAFGGEIRTPTLDTLAGHGVRFTQFYNGARCCPTRAALMTGLYAHQAGVGHMVEDEIATDGPGYGGGLNRRCVTIPEALKGAGYATYMVGKWHIVAGADKPDPDMNGWPRQRGFDRYFGTVHGGANYFTGKNENGAGLVSGNTRVDAPAGFYMTENLGDTAVKFLHEHFAKPAPAPFFMYAAFTAPHWPLHALKADIDKYRTRYSAGWEALRAERYARQKRMGLIDPAWPLSPEDAPDWNGLSAAMRDTMALKMAVYAAQIDRLDQNIGKLVAELKADQALDNTLIVFLSDNGACAEGGNFGFGPHNQLETKEGFNISYGQGWAHASNTPFSMYKHYTREGGISSPFIAHWPAGIKAAGALIKQPGHLIDIMPTFLEAAGAAYPKAYQGTLIQPMEGKSLVKAFANADIGRIAPIFWEHEGNKAVRNGKWKILSNGGAPWRLFDMEADRTELADLAGSQATRVASMDSAWKGWADRSYVAHTPIDLPIRIEIVAPAGGEQVQAGTAYPILWGETTDTIRTVKLYYQLNGTGAWTAITESAAQNGSFTWTVPAPAANARIRIASGNDKFADTTEAFTIIPSTRVGAGRAEMPALKWRKEAEGIRFFGVPAGADVKVYAPDGRSLWGLADAAEPVIWRRGEAGSPVIGLIQIRSGGVVRAFRGVPFFE